MEKLFQFLSSTSLVKKITRNNPCLILELQPGRLPGELNRLAFENGIVLDHLVLKRQSLETEFLEITRQ